MIGALLISLVAGVLVFRCELSSRRKTTLLGDGHALIDRGLAGDDAAFAEGERAFANAAGLSDSYPLFALEAARRLRERSFADASPDVRRVFEHLLARRYADAAKALAQVPATLPGRSELSRFVAELALAAESARH